ncbi:MAG: aminodeoxychorismate/anthranilate synthase component II [Caldilineaceae bacterium]|nr:aminodeoxychorismate/anthranilate synthase component II [Caldilineaceae bacterium]
MIAVIDNYDSFTYNLVQFLGEIINKAPLPGGSAANEIRVWRNDEIDVEELADLKPSHIVISPGPGTPEKDSGISNDVIRVLGETTPILGVCLGQQCIGHVFGGEVVRAPRLMHGKVSPVLHKGTGVFAGLPSPFTATRYHSLIVQEPLPADLEATAFTAEGELMGLKHRTKPIYGVQFHPESILTEHGKDILRNFLKINGSAAAA